MNNTKHTPGPWVVKGNTIWTLIPEDGYGLSRPEQHRIIANTSTSNIDKADAANAALIAAAPAMYEALRRIKVLMESGDIEGKDWMEYGQIVQALAQAEGR